MPAASAAALSDHPATSTRSIHSARALTLRRALPCSFIRCPPWDWWLRHQPASKGHRMTYLTAGTTSSGTTSSSPPRKYARRHAAADHRPPVGRLRRRPAVPAVSSTARKCREAFLRVCVLARRRQRPPGRRTYLREELLSPSRQGRAVASRPAWRTPRAAGAAVVPPAPAPTSITPTATCG